MDVGAYIQRSYLESIFSIVWRIVAGVGAHDCSSRARNVG